MCTRLAVMLVAFLGITVPAWATSIWEFQGFVTYNQGSPYPVGTPVTIEWMIQSTVNDCAAIDPDVGIYQGQHLTEHIGGDVYDASGPLLVGTSLNLGCQTFGGPGGPFPRDLVQITPILSVDWGSLDSGAPLGSFPPTQPHGGVFTGPTFFAAFGAHFPQGVVVATPEPSSVRLLVVGALMLVVFYRRGYLRDGKCGGSLSS